MIETKEFDVLGGGYFTGRVNGSAAILPILERLKAEFGAELLAHWPSGSEMNSAAVARLSELELERICSRDREGERLIAFSDDRKESLWASVVWNEVKGKREIERFVDAVGYKQNELHLEVDGERLTSAVDVGRYVELCGWLAMELALNYFHVRHGTEAVGVPRGALNLGAGLCDVYWLNVFGPPFLEIIGEDRLLRCPAHRTEKLAPGLVMVQLTREWPAPRSRELKEARSRARSFLGEEYFVDAERMNNGSKRRQGGAEVVTPFQPLRWLSLLRELSRGGGFEDTDFHARKRPRFDYSDILVHGR